MGPSNLSFLSIRVTFPLPWFMGERVFHHLYWQVHFQIKHPKWSNTPQIKSAPGDRTRPLAFSSVIFPVFSKYSPNSPPLANSMTIILPESWDVFALPDFFFKYNSLRKAYRTPLYTLAKHVNSYCCQVKYLQPSVNTRYQINPNYIYLHVYIGVCLCVCVWNTGSK